MVPAAAALPVIGIILKGCPSSQSYGTGGSTLTPDIRGIDLVEMDPIALSSDALLNQIRDLEGCSTLINTSFIKVDQFLKDKSTHSSSSVSAHPAESLENDQRTALWGTYRVKYGAALRHSHLIARQVGDSVKNIATPAPTTSTTDITKLLAHHRMLLKKHKGQAGTLVDEFTTLEHNVKKTAANIAGMKIDADRVSWGFMKLGDVWMAVSAVLESLIEHMDRPPSDPLYKEAIGTLGSAMAEYEKVTGAPANPPSTRFRRPYPPTSQNQTSKPCRRTSRPIWVKTHGLTSESTLVGPKLEQDVGSEAARHD
ncbi:hypothetical protein BV22DRAFT_1127117 [Leucogyrophana mollusca]|uniref:Uncharacterized protein n=1 Tax=Leucogyrophana mollusca TaxID=85980 RepID=A0ACB8BQ80_9AGAM|nr:hypothetical protein BV22DRAFT_1127117 [Leucogyrophana mollusca]